jgi:glutamate racemase
MKTSTNRNPPSSILHPSSPNQKRIGVFDSGLGGLTVVRALMERLPHIDIVYVADTANAPYGEKSHEQIRLFSENITNYLLRNHSIDALVIACNTATSAAIAHLRHLYPALPIVGTEPGIKPAMKVTRSHKVGIMATPATLAGDKYQELADKLYNGTDIELFEQACPGLAEQIEAGKTEDPATIDMLEKWLEPMKKAGVDTVVLGCTHYPLAADAIKQVMGDDIRLVETGGAIAGRLQELLAMESNEKTKATVDVFATGFIDSGIVGNILGEHTTVERLILDR